MKTPLLTSLTRNAAKRWAGALVQDHYDIETPWHAHEVHQLQYAVTGRMEVEGAQSCALLPRQLAAWIPAGVAHRTSLHRIRSSSVMFSRPLMPYSGTRIRIITVPALMREMIVKSGRWPVDDALDDKGQTFFAAFAMLLGDWLENEAPLSLPTATDARLSAAMAHTRANLATASIVSASQAAAMSVRTLRRRFETAGITWEDYRRRARLLAAVEMLDETTAAVGNIAAEVGYESQSAFTKAFSRLLRMTPSEFRKRL